VLLRVVAVEVHRHGVEELQRGVARPLGRLLATQQLVHARARLDNLAGRALRGAQLEHLGLCGGVDLHALLSALLLPCAQRLVQQRDDLEQLLHGEAVRAVQLLERHANVRALQKDVADVAQELDARLGRANVVGELGRWVEAVRKPEENVGHKRKVGPAEAIDAH
jgi:hypothetical protein